MRKLVGACGVGFVLLLCGGDPARALIIDPTRSSLTPAVGAPQSLSGSLSIELGAEPPLSANTTFDLVALDALASGGLAIGLDPALANPGAGVLSPSGTFLIPNLFLRLDDGLAAFDLSVPDVLGSYGLLPGCPGTVCLATAFEIDTGGPLGVVSVEVFAVPEPASLALLALGLLALAGARRALR
jgi:hypothetical protein